MKYSMFSLQSKQNRMFLEKNNKFQFLGIKLDYLDHPDSEYFNHVFLQCLSIKICFLLGI